MESAEKLHNEILGKITPSRSTKKIVDKTVDELIKKVNLAIKDQNLAYKLEPILVGSVAKDTYLKDPDIDIFILFPVSVPVAELREMGLVLGRAVLPKGEERYAEHPYIFGKFNGFDTDIVPCYKLAKIEDRMTAVDRTPFHTKFIINHLKPGQIGEVRLLKQFIKGIGAYGAEIEVLGFSGYLCELLILKYGTLLNLLKKVSNWPDDLVLKIEDRKSKKAKGEKEYSSKSDLPKKLIVKFTTEPLVFIDPVDSARNVASAVSFDNFNLFKLAAQTYLANPQLVFFFPNKIKPMTNTQLKKTLKGHLNTILGVEFTTPAVVPDILHGQLRKSMRVIQRLLDNAGFSVVYTKYYCDEHTLLLFELQTGQLPDVEIHTGPPENHKNVKHFVGKWRTESAAVGKPYLKDKRWYVEIKREFTTPVGLLKGNINKIGLGKHISQAMQAEVQIDQNSDLVRDGLEVPLTHFLTRKNSWEY